MARKVYLPVIGKLDLAAGVMRGTVTIDRDAGLFEVRPLRRKKAYVLPLSTVADMVVQRLVKAEVFQKRMEKAAKRKLARKGWR